MLLILDNYDSFTWNLQHLLEPLVDVVVVKRNDDITVGEASKFDRIVLSPGPGLPKDAGIMMELIDRLGPTHSILGVCLGMQGIVEAFGGTLFNMPEVMHGRSVKCLPKKPIDPLFSGLEHGFDVGLYHSWAADRDALPKDLIVTAELENGVAMAVQHNDLNVCGVQFHPESVMTEAGEVIMKNWTRSTLKPKSEV